MSTSMGPTADRGDRTSASASAGAGAGAGGASRTGRDGPSPSPWPWLVALAPAVVWFAHLNVSYLLVPVSCRVGHPWWLVAVSIPPALIAGWATVTSWRFSRGSARPATDRAGGFTGFLLGAMFLLAIGATTLSNAVVDPCR